jgi:hypothetical protein
MRTELFPQEMLKKRKRDWESSMYLICALWPRSIKNDWAVFADQSPQVKRETAKAFVCSGNEAQSPAAAAAASSFSL